MEKVMRVNPGRKSGMKHWRSLAVNTDNLSAIPTANSSPKYNALYYFGSCPRVGWHVGTVTLCYWPGLCHGEASPVLPPGECIIWETAFYGSMLNWYIIGHHGFSMMEGITAYNWSTPWAVVD